MYINKACEAADKPVTFWLQDFNAWYAIARREIKRFLRFWPQTLLPPAITTLLYLVLFGMIIGRHVPDIDGYPYFVYLVPGLVIMPLINNAFINVVSSFFAAKFQGFIEEILVAPVDSQLIILGYVAGGTARGVSVGLLVFIVASLFVHLHPYNVAMMLLILVLASILFSLIGLINALFAKKHEDYTIFINFILTPLTYLGGVFFSIKMLHGVWQFIAMINPILYIVNAFRYSCLGVSDIPLGYTLTALISFVIVFYFIALKIFDLTLVK